MAPSGFTQVALQPIPALGVEFAIWSHPCGAIHYHLGCGDEHRAFVVAFRTVPQDSTGLPHILEHTTLCGSRRYPVRDPFFQMLRRSLQTFMNAMTFPDLTGYPFASQVAKDYDNLLGVYLDAVFAPLLDPLDFAQEGHRLVPDGADWQRKGVVFNEMKGAMDGTNEQMGMATAAALLPQTCYRFNYGGDPADIPRLRHRDLVAFHQRCYRPANACFVTYGDQPASELHARLAPYLDLDGGPGQPLPPPALQPPLSKSQVLDVPVPQGEDQDVLDVTCAALTWTWGDSADLDEVLTAELIDRLLLGHAGAPLRLALDNSRLGRSTAGSGYGASYRNGIFTAEISGIPVQDYPRFVPLVEQTLASTVASGFPPAEVAAALDQLELARREITGDHYPYGLELCFRLLAPWNHGADPLPFLDQAGAIARLRSRCEDPIWLTGELERRFIRNPHHVQVFARPDRAFHARAQEQERAGVAAEIATLDAAGRATLVEQAERLAERQARQDDPSVLPDLDLSDVPSERRWAEGRDEAGISIFTPGTNGLLHQVVAFDLPRLDEEDLDLLPLLTITIGSLGAGGLDYAARARDLNSRCGGLWAWNDIGATPEDLGVLTGLLFCEVKGLAAKQAHFSGLLAETLGTQRFDELPRLRELLEQALQRLQERAHSSGNAFAARAAMRGFGGAASLGHRLSGLGRLAWLKRTAAAIAAPTTGDAALAQLAERLQALLSRIRAQPRHLAAIGDAAGRAEVRTAMANAWGMGTPAGAAERLSPLGALAAAPTAYTTATAVSYVALAFPTVPLGHVDAPALAVAGRLLTNNILHPRIREQGGAYGAAASYTGSSGAFTITSYRDPRFVATIDDMRSALRWLGECPADARLLKEAALGVLASLDAPGSPAGEARMRFTSDLKGTGPQRMNQVRRRILATSIDDVRRIARVWLPADGGTLAAVTNAEILSASGLGWASEAI